MLPFVPYMKIFLYFFFYNKMDQSVLSYYLYLFARDILLRYADWGIVTFQVERVLLLDDFANQESDQSEAEPLGPDALTRFLELLSPTNISYSSGSFFKKMMTRPKESPFVSDWIFPLQLPTTSILKTLHELELNKDSFQPFEVSSLPYLKVRALDMNQILWGHFENEFLYARTKQSRALQQKPILDRHSLFSEKLMYALFKDKRLELQHTTKIEEIIKEVIKTDDDLIIESPNFVDLFLEKLQKNTLYNSYLEKEIIQPVTKDMIANELVETQKIWKSLEEQEAQYLNQLVLPGCTEQVYTDLLDQSTVIKSYTPKLGNYVYNKTSWSVLDTRCKSNSIFTCGFTDVKVPPENMEPDPNHFQLFSKQVVRTKDDLVWMLLDVWLQQFNVCSTILVRMLNTTFDCEEKNKQFFERLRSQSKTKKEIKSALAPKERRRERKKVYFPTEE